MQSQNEEYNKNMPDSTELTPLSSTPETSNTISEGSSMSVTNKSSSSSSSKDFATIFTQDKVSIGLAAGAVVSLLLSQVLVMIILVVILFIRLKNVHGKDPLNDAKKELMEKK